MSFAIDVNILVCASDSSSPVYSKAVSFLKDCAVKREVFCFPWFVAMSYLRIVTHPSIFRHPLSSSEACRNVDTLISLPHCCVIGEQEDFWSTFTGVMKETPARGNLIRDVHLAAVLAQNGVTTLYTHDRDFRRFDFLEVRDPLT